MREARIAMRTIGAARDGQGVADEDLKRMVDAVEIIASWRRGRDDGRAKVIAWLKAKREEIGLMELAKMLGVDEANLGKVIKGNRRVSQSLQSKVAQLCRF